MKNSPFPNMKQILLICAVVALVGGCGTTSSRIAGKYVVYQGGSKVGVATFTEDGRVFEGVVAEGPGTWEWKGENILIKDKEGNIATLKVSGANSLIGISVINGGILIPIEKMNSLFLKKPPRKPPSPPALLPPPNSIYTRAGEA